MYSQLTLIDWLTQPSRTCNASLISMEHRARIRTVSTMFMRIIVNFIAYYEKKKTIIIIIIITMIITTIKKTLIILLSKLLITESKL